ncbi:MAG: P-loop NTPase, partial [Clostridia bacterium]
MSEENCTHDCSNCGENCASRETKSLIEKPNELSSIKKVIAVMSGKGGVGKSLVTSLLAVEMQRKGYNSAILDADMTGPSIPRAFGLKQKAGGTENGILPVKT